ncbi:type II secretion system F family protein [Paenibacillus marinisediminis]
MLPTWLWLLQAAGGAAAIWLVNRFKAELHLDLMNKENVGKLKPWLPAFLELLKPYQQTFDTHPLLMPVRQALLQLHGPAHAYNRFRLFMAELAFMLAAGVLFGFIWAAVTEGTAVNMLTGSLLGIVLALARVKETIGRAEKRKQDMQLELPELLSKLTLLVQAGETVQKALQTCLQRKAEQLEHPLYHELERMMKDMQHGYAFAQALEQFAKRCAVQEVSMFATTLLMNQRRGGESFVLAMEDLGRQLWEKRKAVARKRGEEASTKLIFPVMLMFLVVLIIVGGPAFLMM